MIRSSDGILWTRPAEWLLASRGGLFSMELRIVLIQNVHFYISWFIVVIKYKGQLLTTVSLPPRPRLESSSPWKPRVSQLCNSGHVTLSAHWCCSLNSFVTSTKYVKVNPLLFNWAPRHEGTRCRWVDSFTPQPLYPQGKSSRYPLELRTLLIYLLAFYTRYSEFVVYMLRRCS
jgi:hypothetical protein